MLHHINCSVSKPVVEQFLPGRHCIFSTLQLFTFSPRMISAQCLLYGASFVHSQYVSSKLHIQITKAHYFLPYLLLSGCHRQKLKFPKIIACIYF